jgi:hypothetical protein
MSSIEEKLMISTLREEYDSRLNYFLKERISIKDKRGENLIKDAIGLKVRDKAGFEYTVGGVVKKGEEEFIKLYLPEIGREIEDGKSTSPLYEFDGEDVESGSFGRGFISRKSKSSGMRDVDYDIDAGYAGEDYSSDDDEPQVGDDVGSVSAKKEEKKYILVPLGEFEERFEV